MCVCACLGVGERREGVRGAARPPTQVTVVVAVLSQGRLDGEQIWEKRLSSVLVVSMEGTTDTWWEVSDGSE